MAQKAIREADGKRMIARLLKDYTNGKYTIDDTFVTVGPDTDLKETPNHLQMAHERKTGCKTRSTHQKTREKQTLTLERRLERCGKMDQRTNE